MSWFGKWFWEMWFELDNVQLHAARRGKLSRLYIVLSSRTDYLEYKMGTIKLYNGRNNFLSSYFIQIPYYIFLGCSRTRDASAAAKAFEVEAGNKLGQGRGGLLTPSSPFTTSPWPGSPAMEMTTSAVPSEFTLGPAAIEAGPWTQSIRDVGAPLSPFHYQLRKVSFPATKKPSCR
jgi:betaine lipid synthase